MFITLVIAITRVMTITQVIIFITWVIFRSLKKIVPIHTYTHMAVLQILLSSFPVPVRNQGNELVLSFGSICTVSSPVVYNFVQKIHRSF